MLKSHITAMALISLAACGPLLDDSKDGKKQNPSDDIPADPAGIAPEPTKNNLKPVFSVEKSKNNPARIRINLPGLLDSITNLPITFRANETVFVTEDGKLKGIRVSQAQASNSLPYDVVFLVDNSWSMGEEADTVADKILDFAAMLGQSGLDVRMGIVGFDGTITGGIDLTSAQELKSFLTRPYRWYSGKTEEATPEERRQGIDRTFGFAGPNQNALETAAQELNGKVALDENGVFGLVFAEKTFSFRPSAQRIYIQFTDEPTQERLPAPIVDRQPWHGIKDYHIKSYCASWKPQQGVVHTIWSGSTTTIKDAQGIERPTPWYSWTKEEENPFDLSTCTGGTQMLVKSSAEDLDLTQLSVTKALTNSALVEFISSNPSAPHKLEVTVKNGDTADGRITLDGKVY